MTQQVVTTVRSGKEYRTTFKGKSLRLMLDGFGIVWIYGNDCSYGGYNLERFGKLSPSSIRQFFGGS